VADLMSAGPNGPFPYLGEPSVTLSLLDDTKLQGILGWIENGTAPSTPHQYWSWGVLRNNLLQLHKHLESKELLLFNNYVKLG